MPAKGVLFVISAPSGAGKTTLVHQMLNRFPSINYSISSTTRAPRKGEVDGQDYFFITQGEFQDKITQGAWLEWAQVHGNFYGTSKEFVTSCLDAGNHLLVDIDIQGAAKVMASEFKPVTIFILPPSFEELANRLTNRGTDSEDVIKLRLKNAKQEMEQQNLYQYTVVNDDLDQAVEELARIFEKEMAL